METRLRAVYKGGVFQPLDRVPLEDMRQVTLTISDSCGPDDDLAAYFTPDEWSAAAHDKITWQDVRHALSKISGSLSDAVIAERQER